MKQVVAIILLSVCTLAVGSCAYFSEVHILSPERPQAYISLDAFQPTPDTSREIRVLSFNIRLCGIAEEIADYFSSNDEFLNADIICLQEMCSDTVVAVANTLEYNYIFYPAAIHPKSDKEFGVAILSRWPIAEVKRIDLPHTETDKLIKLQRIAARATIERNNKRITVFSVHLGVLIKTRERKEQIMAILKMIPDTSEYCIVAGDFNTYNRAHRQIVVDTLKGEGFQWTTRGVPWTYREWFFPHRKTRLDHIFTKGAHVKESGVIQDMSVSDHRPVWAQLILH